MPASKAQIKAHEKYNKKHYDGIYIRIPKGQKENISAHAIKYDGSLNKFLNRAINETIERDSRKNKQL